MLIQIEANSITYPYAMSISECISLIKNSKEPMHLWIDDTIKMEIRAKSYTLSDCDDLYSNCKMNPSDFTDDKESVLAKKIIAELGLEFKKDITK
jgi:hypothetical protein